MDLFNPGRIVVTRGIEDRRCRDLRFFGFLEESIARHLGGDWGDLCAEDREMNDEAIAAEQRGEPTDSLFSMYRHSDGTEVYIITEWNREITTILYPEEY